MVDIPTPEELKGSYYSQLQYKLKVYRVLMVIFGFITMLAFFNMVTSKNKVLWGSVFAVCLMITVMFVAMNEKIIKAMDLIRATIIMNEIDSMARSDSIDRFDVNKKIIDTIGTDVYVNLQACKYFPEWCGLDAVGNVLELGACKADPKSKACAAAKAAVKTIEIPVEKMEKLITSSLTKLDKELHAHGVFSGAVYDGMLASAGATITTGILTAGASALGTETAAAIGAAVGLDTMGTAALTLSAAAGPVGLAVGAAVFAGVAIYEGVESCERSKRCREIVDTIGDDTKKAVRALTLSAVRSFHDVEDGFEALFKGKVDVFAKDIGKAIIDLF